MITMITSTSDQLGQPGCTEQFSLDYRYGVRAECRLRDPSSSLTAYGKSRNLLSTFIPVQRARGKGLAPRPLSLLSLSQDEDDEPLLRVRRPVHGSLRRRGGGGEEFVRRASIWK